MIISWIILRVEHMLSVSWFSGSVALSLQLIAYSYIHMG